MPLRTFWSFNRQVDRLRAEAEQRLFRLHGALEDPKSAKAFTEVLETELNSPVVTMKKFDTAKFDELKKAMK